MNSKNQVDRAVKTLVDGIKDAVDANIVAAVRSKQVDVKPEHLPTLLALVKASIDEGHIKGTRVFIRAVIDACGQPAVTSAPAAKKKTT